MSNLLAGLHEATEYARRNNGRGGSRWAPPTGDEIRRIRKGLDLSQPDFAERYGLDLVSLRKWEQNRTTPEQVTCLMLRMIAKEPSTIERLVDQVRELVPH